MLRCFFFLFAFVFTLKSAAQSSHATIDGARAADSMLWYAYNHCDIAKMQTYFASDVEFYHDKGGITLGSEDLAASFTKGPCSNTDSLTMRRAALPKSEKTYPLEKNGKLYGVIITGEHLFYLNEKGKKERAEGQAKFTTLWLLENDRWRMKRVLSYDHQPAPYENERTVASVPVATLKSYAGKYTGRKMGVMVVQVAKQSLIIVSGNVHLTAYPSTSTVFFVKDRDLTFEFAKKPAGIMDVIVRENGSIVDTFTAARR